MGRPRSICSPGYGRSARDFALVAQIRIADGDGTPGEHDGFAVDQGSRRFRAGQPAIAGSGVNPEHRESRGAFNQPP